MITVIEQDIYTSSLCFWGNTKPTNITPGSLPLGETYALDPSSIMIYRNREPNANGGATPTLKRVNRISLEPLWEYNYMNQYVTNAAGTDYYGYFRNVALQPFVASAPLNNLTQNFFGFSASDDVQWMLNQNGPAFSTSSVNDVHYADKFVLQPWEDLKVRLLDAELSSTLPGAGAADFARTTFWQKAWMQSTEPVAKIRIELEEFDPSSQYYHRVNLNTLDPTPNGVLGALIADQDIMLVDLREASPTLLEKPFDKLFFNNYFQLQNLDFRSAYPWGGISTTTFMYSIILHTEGNPPATRFIRKYVLFKGGAATDLEINGLLKDVGPLNMQRGQYLVVKLYAFQSSIPTATEAYTARQMPAFWLNGSIT
tara:strand:+ start:2821 stop:3930 length:1110 start_codon:yes stop_codon:yes gene_type:complete